MAQTHSLDLEASSSQYASIADASQTGLDITGDISFEAWVKLESLGNKVYILSKDDYVSGERGYGFYIDTSNRPSAYFANASDQFTEVRTGTALTTGVWYHLAVSIDVSAGDSGFIFYLNGFVLSNTTISNNATSIGNNSADFRVGMQSPDANFFDGQIKDVRVFSDIRSGAEIASDAHTEDVSDANLVGEWNFNNAYTDSSGNSNTLTSSGSPVFTTNIPWQGTAGISGSTYLETNLVSYWSLDESSGTRVDAHSTNDLTDNNTVLAGTGKISNGADFERDNSESLTITDGSQSGLDIVGNMSISFWWKPESNNVFQWLISKYLLSGNQRGYGVYFDGTNSLNFASSSDGTSTNTVDLGKTFIPSNGTWYYIAISYSTTGVVETFVNGVSLGINSGYKTSIFNSSSEFAIGRGNLDSWTDGIIDEVAVYSRALHYGDVLDLYDDGNGTPYTGVQNLTLTADQGSYTLTGQDVTLRRGKLMVADLGQYVLTGFDVILRRSGWTNQSKNSSSWSNRSKNSSNFTNASKATSVWTNQSKS